MLKILKELMGSQKYANIYTDPNTPTKFIYGRILAVNAEQVGIYMLSTQGLFDGILALRLSDIYRVDVDGQYETVMQKLCAQNPEPLPDDYFLDQEDIFRSLLTLAQQRKLVVSCEMLASGIQDVVGFVEELGPNLCKIKYIESYGYEDGFSYVQLKDMTQISCDSEEEARTLKLWKLNYNK